jgi:hypothetical protein
MATNNSLILSQLAKSREKKLPKPKKPLRKVSLKKQKEADKEKELAKQDEDFYKEFWQSAPHSCYECGGRLGRTPYNFMFHHLLEKNNYPQFRHTFENIALVCLTCHSKAETNLKFAPKIKALTEQTKKVLL